MGEVGVCTQRNKTTINKLKKGNKTRQDKEEVKRHRKVGSKANTYSWEPPREGKTKLLP